MLMGSPGSCAALMMEVSTWDRERGRHGVGTSSGKRGEVCGVCCVCDRLRLGVRVCAGVCGGGLGWGGGGGGARLE